MNARPSAFCQRPPSQYVGLVRGFQVDVLDGAHALSPERREDAGECVPEGRQLVDMAVRVDVGDLDALVAHYGDLRGHLARDLLDR